MTLLSGFNPRLRTALAGKTTQYYVAAAAAADATLERPIFYAEKDTRILRVGIVPHSAITGADTNSFTLNVIDKGTDGTGTTVLGTKAYVAGVNVATYDLDTIVTEVAGKTVKAGSVLNMERVKVGTGLATPSLLVTIAYELIGQ